MVRYAIKRILTLIPVILGVTVLVFTIMNMVPGDPVLAVLGADADPNLVEAKREEWGLNRPFLVRLFDYMGDVFLRLDFGISYSSELPIWDELKWRLPNSLILSFVSLIITIGIGIPLGIHSALNAGKPSDWLSMAVALLGVSMPGFWLALMLVVLFAVKLEWLPAFGMGGIKYWILPILSSAFSGVAGMARQTRSSMLEVLGQDYIVMAKAKGMPMRSVIFQHALPNALIPVITVIGNIFGGALGGGMLLETIFSIPGVGYYVVKGINSRDYPVVMGCVLVLSVFFGIVMVITDIVMAAVDPRVKARFVSTTKRRK